MKTESDYIFSTSINKGLSGIVKVTNPPIIICFCNEDNGKIILKALEAIEQKPDCYEKEFAQYCAEDMFNDFDQETDDLGIYHYICLNDGEDYSFDELHDYWKENIKEK